MSLSEQEFRVKSDEALDAARHALLPLADSDGFEVELQNGVLNLVFEEPIETKFVVSPNAPVRQIWVSAMSRSFKLSWAPELGAFALDGEALPALLDRLTRSFLGAGLKAARRDRSSADLQVCAVQTSRVYETHRAPAAHCDGRDGRAHRVRAADH